MPPPPILLALVLSVSGVLATAPARAEEAAGTTTIYKWVDTNGVAHYTTELGRVPRSVRGSVRALGGGSTPAAEADVAPRGSETAAGEVPPPPAEPLPTAERLPEWDVGEAPPPAPASAPAPGRPTATGKDRWAETDRPLAAPPGTEVETPAAQPAQTASASVPEAPAPSAAEIETQRRALDARIASLEQEIASDEDALKGFLSVAGPQDPAEIAYDSSFREVAARLPKRLAELRGLQSERAQLDPR